MKSISLDPEANSTEMVLKPIQIEPFKEDDLPKSKNEEESDKNTIEQLRRESKRMWLTDSFVNRPLSVLIIGYAVLIFLTYLSVELEYFVISDQSPRDFLIWSD